MSAFFDQVLLRSKRFGDVGRYARTGDAAWIGCAAFPTAGEHNREYRRQRGVLDAHRGAGYAMFSRMQLLGTAILSWSLD